MGMRTVPNCRMLPIRSIKDYDENEGLLAALEGAGIVRTTGVRCRLGFVQADVCQLLIPAPAVH